MTTSVLIFGGDGMLGQMLVRKLAAKSSLSVSATSRRETPNTIRFEVGKGEKGVQELFAQHGPYDFVINCIAVLAQNINPDSQDSVSRAIQVNEMFPKWIADVGTRGGAKIIHVSTDGVFRTDAGVCLESRPCDATDYYGRTKAAGEVIAPDVLNIRCSLVGPDRISRRGLLEWFLSQEQGAEIRGFTNQRWNGVTTLQLANLVATLIEQKEFDEIRREGAIHHFCSNQAVTKYELLQIFQKTYRPDITVLGVLSPSEVSRILGTEKQSLAQLFGAGFQMEAAIKELALEHV